MVATTASSASTSGPNRAIFMSILLSIGLTLILWWIQSAFHLSSFWIFLIYIAFLFLLFYVVLPKLRIN